MKLAAKTLKKDTADSLEGRYLTFTVEDEVYGIELGCVTEITGLHPITEIPAVSDYIRGTINLRGRVFPVIDMQMRLSKPFIPYSDRTCIIVLDVESITVGLIVDGVSEVLTIDQKNIKLPGLKLGFKNRFIKGIGQGQGGKKLLMDCQKLFGEKELKILAGIV